MHRESVLAFDHHETVDNKYNDETGDEYNTTVSYDDVNQAASTILSISEEEEVIVILLVIDVTLSASFLEHLQMLFLIFLKL